MEYCSPSWINSAHVERLDSQLDHSMIPKNNYIDSSTSNFENGQFSIHSDIKTYSTLFKLINENLQYVVRV